MRPSQQTIKEVIKEYLTDLSKNIELTKKEQKILDRLEGDLSLNNQEKHFFEEEKIYTLEQIKKLCIKYRLRFLDSKVFKGDFPHEAILKIKAIAS